MVGDVSQVPQCFKRDRCSVVPGHKDELVLFSFLPVKPDLCPDLSRFRVDAEVIRLPHVLVVHFEEVAGGYSSVL